MGWESWNSAFCFSWSIVWVGMIKTRVHGFFETDIHERSWHFATLCSKLNWQSEDQCQKPIQNEFLFLSHS